MSAEVSIALAVAGRVLANILCTNKPQLGAGIVGLSNGLLIHRAWLARTLFDPFTLLILFAGIAFDHSVYSIYGAYGQGGLEGVLTEVMACGMGVILADVGPDVWYELAGERFGKQINRELDALGLGGLMPYNGDYDSASDVDSNIDDRSDVGSVVSGASSRRTSRSARSSATIRPSRPRPTPTPFTMAGVSRGAAGARTTSASTITRLSRVTFDESSITGTQSQSSDADVEEVLSASAGASEGNGNDLYMEPSTTSSSRSASSRTQTVRRPSILRRLDIPGQETTTNTITVPSASTSSSTTSSSRTRLTSDGETTPRATVRPEFPEFTPLSPPAGYAAPAPTGGPEPGPSFSEPDLSSATTTISTNGFEEYSPKIIPPSEPSPDLSPLITLPEPVHFPDTSPVTPGSAITVTEPGVSPEDGEYHGHNGPSRFSQIMNVPIAPPSPASSRHEERTTQTPPLPNPFDHNGNGHLEPKPESPESARLWAGPAPRPRSKSRERSRERSRSPAGPRPQPPSSNHGSPPPLSQSLANTFGPDSYISETFDDSTIDVRPLTREEAILRIEEAWKNVEKKHHRRLNILVRHDDEELQTSARKNSTFHLMEDLENLRFNFKIRPGIIIITSRSRG